jgi:hypothetical protein
METCFLQECQELFDKETFFMRIEAGSTTLREQSSMPGHDDP